MNKAGQGEEIIEDIRRLFREKNLLCDLEEYRNPTAEEIESSYQDLIANGRPDLRGSHRVTGSGRMYVLAASIAMIFGVALTGWLLVNDPAFGPGNRVDNVSDPVIAHAIRLANAYQPVPQGDVQFVRINSLTTNSVPRENNDIYVEYGHARVFSWIDSNGGGRIDTHIVGGVQDSPKIDEIDQMEVIREVSSIIPSGTFSPTLVDDLPRDTARLRESLIKLNEGIECGVSLPTANCILNSVVQLYAFHVIPNDLASAIWQVVAEIDQLSTSEDAVDQLGRPALSVSVSERLGSEIPTTTTLFISPETGRLIGVEETGPEGSGSQLLGAQYWLDSGFVAEVGDQINAPQA